jgi:hypothetical protein
MTPVPPSAGTCSLTSRRVVPDAENGPIARPAVQPRQLGLRAESCIALRILNGCVGLEAHESQYSRFSEGVWRRIYQPHNALRFRPPACEAEFCIKKSCRTIFQRVLNSNALAGKHLAHQQRSAADYKIAQNAGAFKPKIVAKRPPLSPESRPLRPPPRTRPAHTSADGSNDSRNTDGSTPTADRLARR